MRNGAIPKAGVRVEGRMGCYGGRSALEMFAPDSTWSPPRSTGFDPTARTASSGRGPVAAGAVTVGPASSDFHHVEEQSHVSITSRGSLRSKSRHRTRHAEVHTSLPDSMADEPTLEEQHAMWEEVRTCGSAAIEISSGYEASTLHRGPPQSSTQARALTTSSRLPNVFDVFVSGLIEQGFIEASMVYPVLATHKLVFGTLRCLREVVRDTLNRHARKRRRELEDQRFYEDCDRFFDEARDRFLRFRSHLIAAAGGDPVPPLEQT